MTINEYEKKLEELVDTAEEIGYYRAFSPKQGVAAQEKAHKLVQEILTEIEFEKAR